MKKVSTFLLAFALVISAFMPCIAFADDADTSSPTIVGAPVAQVTQNPPSPPANPSAVTTAPKQQTNATKPSSQVEKKA